MARRTGRGNGADDSAPDPGDFGLEEPIDPVTLAGGNGSDANDGGPGNGDGGDDFTFDPERHIGIDRRNADGSYRRKRRTGKRGPRKSSSSSSLDIGTVSAILMSVHAGVAGMIATPELMLSEPEAKQLGQGLLELERCYPMAVDPRVLAWVNMTAICGMIYGPRIMAIRMRRQNERPQRQRREPQKTESGGVQGVVDPATGAILPPGVSFVPGPDLSA